MRHVVGVMTGTSIDGIDAALVRIHGTGLEMRAELVRHISQSLHGLRVRLRSAAEQAPMSAGDFARLAWDFGHLHASVIRELVSSPAAVDLISAHGQTVFHQPPISWQLLNPAPIAAAFKCPVVFDLRQADLAAGGQGAPITPIADWILFRDEKKSRAIVNLGGFCNMTILPKRTPHNSAAEFDRIRGFDVCSCNQLLDAVARAALNLPFDEGGRAAASGQLNAEASQTLLKLLTDTTHKQRSLGTGDGLTEWVETHHQRIEPADLAATATTAVGLCIAGAVHQHDIDEAIVAGGGARNHELVARIRAGAECAVTISSDLGVPIEAREAMCFAVLGALCQDRVPITLRQVTGCASPAPISGVWCLP